MSLTTPERASHLPHIPCLGPYPCLHHPYLAFHPFSRAFSLRDTFPHFWETPCIAPPHAPYPTLPSPSRELTFVVGKLQVVIHGGHKLLHEVAADVGGEIGFAVHLALEGLCKEI